jgi:hypothetical protein
MDRINIYIFIILAALFTAINEIVKNYSLKQLPKSVATVGMMITLNIIIGIFWLFQDKKNMTLDTFLNLDIKQKTLITITALTVVAFTILLIEAYSRNVKLKNQINVGILGGIFTMQFVFSFIIDIIVKKYLNEPIDTKGLEILSMLIIITGVGLTIYSRIKQ